MTTRNLYRYNEPNGSMTVTYNKRNDEDEIYKKRLIADEGKELKKGNRLYFCIDVFPEEEPEWKEIDINGGAT